MPDLFHIPAYQLNDFHHRVSPLPSFKVMNVWSECLAHKYAAPFHNKRKEIA